MATNSPESSLPKRPVRRAPRYAFTATANAIDSSDVRHARVKDLSIFGAYLVMLDPFAKGASIQIKIRTKNAFFRASATVAHSTDKAGMGVEFREVSPPFLHVLHGWLARTL